MRHIQLTTVILALLLGSFFLLTPHQARAASAAEIDKKVDLALETLYASSPTAKELATVARGILVFPDIIKAGLVIGGQFGKGGKATLFVNDQQVGEGRIERTQPMIFSADETADVGIDLATPVVEAIGAEAKSRFTGKIPKVTVEVKEAPKQAVR